MNEYTIKCPHCGSTELQSNDLIGATCSINSWSIEAGRLVPEYCGESDVDWDSQKAANPQTPYQCGECFTLLSEADIAANLPKKAQKQVKIPAPAVPKVVAPSPQFHLFYIEASDSDGVHAYMVSRAGDESAAKAEAEKGVLDVLGGYDDAERASACAIEHSKRISGCDLEFFEVVGLLAGA